MLRLAVPLCRGTMLAQYPFKFSLSKNLNGAEEARTPDLLNANQTLSQLSYCPISAFCFRLSVFSFNLINFNFGWLLKADSWLLKKWAQVDSNHWPQSYQGCALTNWAMGPNLANLYYVATNCPDSICLLPFAKISPKLRLITSKRDTSVK